MLDRLPWMEALRTGAPAEKLWGATLLDWLLFGAALALAWPALSALHRFVRWRLRLRAEGSPAPFYDYAYALVQRTRWFFLLFVALLIASLLTDVPAVLARGLAFASVLALLAQIGLWGNAAIARWIERYRRRKLDTDAGAVTSINAVGWIARAGLWAVIGLLMLDHFGQDVTALITGLGIGGVAVALAVQNILGDLFASLSIVLDKPFVVGETLAVDTFVGTVEHVGLKTTRVRSISGEQVIFSNSDLLKSRIRNYKRMSERRVLFTLDLTYDTPPEKMAAAPEMLRAIIEAEDGVRFDRSHFRALAAYALQIETVYFVLTPDYLPYMDVQHRINLEILRRFHAAGLSFAFPTQSIQYAPAPGPEPRPAEQP